MLGLTTLLVISVVLGAVGPLDNVGMRVVAPRIVPERDLPSANGLRRTGKVGLSAECLNLGR